MQLVWEPQPQAYRVGGFNYEALRMLGSAAYGGADIGEVLDIVRRVRDGDFESWVVEWQRTADHLHGQAELAYAAGRLVTARQAYLRAATYYNAASFNVRHTDDRKYQLWERAKSSFVAAAALHEPAVEVLDVPFGDALLPAYFVNGGAGRRATLLAIGGYDSSAEEVYQWIGAAAAEHGFHALVVEGPGQVGALHRNPGLLMRPDYEVPVSAMVDYLVSRGDVDADRLAIIGYSAGGYLAPRAAAFEPRLKACVANGLIHDVSRYFLLNWPEEMRSATPADFGEYYRKLVAEHPAIEWAASHAAWTFGIRAPEDFLTAWIPYNLAAVRDRITFPLLAIEGETVPELMENGGEFGRALRQEVDDFFESLPSTDKTAVYGTWLDGAALHCNLPGQSTSRAFILDWLQDRLGDPAPAATGVAA